MEIWNFHGDGKWKFNKANGWGKFWHVDGDIFDGEWKDDMKSGKGMLYLLA